MKARIITLNIFSFVLFSITSVNAQQIIEKNYFANNPELGADVTITSSTNEVIGDLSYTKFEVEAESSGNYYINFWLIPAKYKDGSFTNYDVLVNECLVGKISPQMDNWQSIGLSTNTKVKLDKGANTISIVAKVPEVPEVEFVRLSKTASKSLISSSAYTNYLSKSKNNDTKSNFQSFALTSIDTVQKNNNNIKSTIQSPTQFIERGVPFQYTFYKKHYFYAGEEIFVTSDSRNIHVLEFFSADNTEFLSWVHTSEPSQNDPTIYLATIRLSIPVQGYYYIKCRNYGLFQNGIVNVNVDGYWFYNSVPIYNAGFRTSQALSASGGMYAAYTCNSTSDPVIWMEQGVDVPGRIVAYNDNCSYNARGQYGLRDVDSYVCKQYSMPVYAVLVNTFGSYNPSGICDIYAGVASSITNSFSSFSPALRQSTGSEDLNVNKTMISPNPVNLSSAITVSMNDNIEKIEVFDISGKSLQRKSIGRSVSEINYSLSELNINQIGMYIVKIYQKNGKFHAKKIVVN